MAKNSIRDYSATNSANTDIQSIDISEGCSPAGINNAIREVMADLKDVSTGAVALESPAMDSLTVDTTGIVYSGGNVGIGTASPNSYAGYTALTLDNATNGGIIDIERNGTLVGEIFTDDVNTFTLQAVGSKSVNFRTNGSERMRIDASGNVGIGVVPESWGSAFPSVLQVGASASLTTSGGDNARLFGNVWYDGTNYKRITSGFAHQYEQTGGTHRWSYAANGAADSTISFSEAMRIDSSGNLLVGHTAEGTWSSNNSAILRASGVATFTATSTTPLYVNRLTNFGTYIDFRWTGTTVGYIGIGSGTGNPIYIGSGSTGLDFEDANDAIRPVVASNGNARDNVIDLGRPDVRFDDIYATNGTIQTSDANEKQQIAALTDAEMTAAKSISALFKTFKWNDAVAEKGDAARTHAGVIAQDVQAAMTAAGLDAGDYAFFISSTWWETQTEVPAVEAVDAVYEDVVIPAVLDDDGNEIEAERTEQRMVTEAVEAVAAYTRIGTYNTAEEAPEGATERTRMGIRYPELLSFIGAATEQRLSNIETRLAALEAN